MKEISAFLSGEACVCVFVELTGSGRGGEVPDVLAASRIGGSRNTGKPYCWGNLKTRQNLAASQRGNQEQWPPNLRRRNPNHPRGGGRITTSWPGDGVCWGDTRP